MLSSPSVEPNVPMPSLRYVFMYLTFLMLIALALCIRKLDGPAPAPLVVPTATTTPVNWAAGKRKVLEQFEVLARDTDEREWEVWMQFAADWADTRERCVTRVVEAKMRSVNAQMAWKEVAGLLLDFAQDKFCSGDSALERIEGNARPFLEALMDVAAAGEAEVRKTNERMHEINNRFAMNIGTIIDDAEVSVPPRTFQALRGLGEDAARQCTMSVVANSGAVVLEAVAARATIESVKTVCAWLGRVLAPYIVRTSTALATAEVPFIDLISVGLLAWTAHDVFTLPEKIQTGLDAQFKQAMEVCLKEIESGMDASVEGLKRQYHGGRTQALERVVEAMN